MILVSFKKEMSGIVSVHLTGDCNPVGRITINPDNRHWDLWIENVEVLRNVPTLGQAKKIMQAVLIAAGRADNISDDIPTYTNTSRSKFC